MRKTVAMMASAIAILIAGCDSEPNSDSGNNSNLSFKARVGRRVLDRLPASQREALLSGSGSFDDEANALANLSSDELDAVTEYLKSTSR